MLGTTDESGTKLSEDEVEAQALTFMAAGFGTTTSALSFTLYLLAQHPEHQERCHEEACAALESGTLDYSELSKYIIRLLIDFSRALPP